MDTLAPLHPRNTTVFKEKWSLQGVYYFADFGSKTLIVIQ